MLRKTATAMASAALCACATFPHDAPVDAETEAIASEPLMCSSEEQCKLFWQRAQFWLATNSAYKMQVISDTILETYNGPRGSVNFSYRVFMERNQGGSARIWIHAFCANDFGCAEPTKAVFAKFKTYVRAGAIRPSPTSWPK